MESWSVQKTLEFIKDYRMHPVLWCKKLKQYKVKRFRDMAMKDLCTKYDCNLLNLRLKIRNLRSYFRKEYTKTMQRRRSTGSPYVSSWFAYDALMFIVDYPQYGHFADTSMDDRNDPGGMLNPNYDWFASDDEMCNGTAEDMDVDDTEIRSPICHEDVPARQLDVANVEMDWAKVRDVTGLMLMRGDDCTIFGDYVACKLRKFKDTYVQSIAQQQITNLLFNIEMATLYRSADMCIYNTNFVQPAICNQRALN